MSKSLIGYVCQLPTSSKSCKTKAEVEKLSRQFPRHVMEVVVYETRTHGVEKLETVWMQNGELVDGEGR